MLQRIAQKIASALKKAAPDQDEESLCYGIQSFISDFSSVMALLIFSIVYGNILETLVFLICFMFLRRYTGGYHADSHLRCFLTTVLCYLGNVAAATLLSGISLTALGIISGALALGSLALVVRYAPHIHKNHPLTVRECKLYGHISRMVTVGLLALAAVLLLCSQKKLALYVLMSVVTTASTLILAVILDKRARPSKKGGEA